MLLASGHCYENVQILEVMETGRQLLSTEFGKLTLPTGLSSIHSESATGLAVIRLWLELGQGVILKRRTRFGNNDSSMRL